MQGRNIRKALHEGRRIYATAVTAPSPEYPDLLQRAGADFVFIDSEHTPLGRENLAWMCQAFAGRGVTPVVRIPCPDAFEAAKVLDGGAGGVIGPYVETADQARALAGAARWRPLKGRRLDDALRDPNTLQPELRTYLEARNQDTLVILNIESVPAIENLDNILSVRGIDSILIGPHDLSCSLGIPEQYCHPRFDEAVRTIFKIARAHGVGAGIHYWQGVGEDEAKWARAGANLLMHSADLTLFSQVLERELDQLRKTLGDARRSGTGGATGVV